MNHRLLMTLAVLPMLAGCLEVTGFVVNLTRPVKVGVPSTEAMSPMPVPSAMPTAGPADGRNGDAGPTPAPTPAPTVAPTPAATFTTVWPVLGATGADLLQADGQMQLTAHEVVCALTEMLNFERATDYDGNALGERAFGNLTTSPISSGWPNPIPVRDEGSSTYSFDISRPITLGGQVNGTYRMQVTALKDFARATRYSAERKFSAAGGYQRTMMLARDWTQVAGWSGSIVISETGPRLRETNLRTSRSPEGNNVYDGAINLPSGTTATVLLSIETSRTVLTVGLNNGMKLEFLPTFSAPGRIDGFAVKNQGSDIGSLRMPNIDLGD